MGGGRSVAAGDLLADRYQLLAQIGEGGMATVWLASDHAADSPSADGHVALKILNPELAKEPDYVRRFEREARTLERLDHRNIVKAFDSGNDGECHFIVMEYLKGRNGKRLIEDDAPLEPAEAARIGAQACDGLACVHRERVVHRDIKPANLMIAGGPGETGRLAVKLTDFGIARADSDTSITGVQQVMGTLVYLAPECLIRGEKATRASDIYSLGVMLYELLTGSRPHDARTVDELIRHLGQPPAPPVERNPRVPYGLSAAVMYALEPEPSARLGDIQTMRRAVLDGAAGKDISDLAPTRMRQTGITELRDGIRRRVGRMPRRDRGGEESPIDWSNVLAMIVVTLVGMVGIVAAVRSIALLSALPDLLFAGLVALVLASVAVLRTPGGRRRVAAALAAAWLAVRPLEDEEQTRLHDQRAMRSRFRIGALRLMRLALVGGMIAYWGVLTYHLRDDMERALRRLPSSEHLSFEIATVAIWVLLGLLPLALLALRRARASRAAMAALLVLAGWTVMADVLPDAPSTIAPWIWPGTRREALEERVAAESGHWKVLLRQTSAHRAHGPPPRRIMRTVRKKAHARTRALRAARTRSQTIRAKRQARHWVSKMRRNRQRWHSRHCRRHPRHVYVSLRRRGVVVACH